MPSRRRLNRSRTRSNSCGFVFAEVGFIALGAQFSLTDPNSGQHSMTHFSLHAPTARAFGSRDIQGADEARARRMAAAPPRLCRDPTARAWTLYGASAGCDHPRA
jgi:hypothetical protein